MINIDKIRARFSKSSLLGRINDRVNRSAFVLRASTGWVFIPGFVLILAAVAILLFPALFITLIATLFLFVGAALCAVAWRFMELKHRLNKTMQQFQGGTVIIQGSRKIDDIFGAEEEKHDKKIILH